nr:MAG TPA: hypothetical protein [Caudoviricetes sp.]DAW31949.1 MAG TPA: hypothetical protein [Caudoviricetes sp.]DAZ38308.1 MAG TPA: hypothetical protein [Caudoviricetes sp.]
MIQSCCLGTLRIEITSSIPKYIYYSGSDVSILIYPSELARYALASYSTISPSTSSIIGTQEVSVTLDANSLFYTVVILLHINA